MGAIEKNIFDHQSQKVTHSRQQTANSGFNGLPMGVGPAADAVFPPVVPSNWQVRPVNGHLI